MQSIYQGEDWGWFPDPKAFLRVAYVPNQQKVYALDELGGCKIRNSEMARQIKEKGYDDCAIYCEVIADYPDGNDHWIDALRYATSPISMRRGQSA